MASGPSGRANSGSKGFDFGSDDILCPYEDYPNQDSTNGNHTEPAISATSGKEYHNSRIGRSSVFPTSYSPPENTFNQDVFPAVEKSIKKYADNIMRFLEGLSSRLSQLELYCYNLDKSIGEMRSDLTSDHGEADTKLKSLDKHIQEVHRSVQILRDKQELADTQKELAKLQLVQKESSSSNHSQSNEDRTSPPASDLKKTDNTPDTSNQQLALALPHQVAPQQHPVTPSPQVPSQTMTHQQSYYLPPTQIPNPPVPVQHSHNQYLPSESQYRPPQVQDITRVSPQQTHSQINHAPPSQSFSQYQQQVPQQLSQQPTMQTQIRPSPAAYPTYQQSQPTNSPPEPLPSSRPMQQLPYSGIPPQGSSRADTMPFGYNGRVVPQQPPTQQIKGTYGAQPGDGYATSGPHPTLPPGNTYMYDGEGGRSHYPPQVSQFAQGGYPPASASLPNAQVNASPNLMVRNPQFNRNYPYSELVEKLAGMGFRADHVASVIQRMEDSGQPIDFNAVIDRLNMHSSGGPQRGWSG